MQEEVVDKSIDIAVRVTSLTLSQILKALEFLTKKLEEKPGDRTPETPTANKDGADPDLKHGKQTLKNLHKHNEGLSTIELTDPNLRDCLNFCLVRPGTPISQGGSAIIVRYSFFRPGIYSLCFFDTDDSSS